MPDHPSSIVVIDDDESMCQTLRRLLRPPSPSSTTLRIIAHDDGANREHSRASGCVACLRNPFPGDLLLAALRSVIGQLVKGD